MYPTSQRHCLNIFPDINFRVFLKGVFSETAQGSFFKGTTVPMTFAGKPYAMKRNGFSHSAADKKAQWRFFFPFWSTGLLLTGYLLYRQFQYKIWGKIETCSFLREILRKYSSSIKFVDSRDIKMNEHKKFKFPANFKKKMWAHGESNLPKKNIPVYIWKTGCRIESITFLLWDFLVASWM